MKEWPTVAGKQSPGGPSGSKRKTGIKNIGILALQGGVREHLQNLQQLSGVSAHEIKEPRQLARMDALILPGGESTTIGKLIQNYNFVDPIRNFHELQKPIWGTCAGAILLAKNILFGPKSGEHRGDQRCFHLSLMNITIKRNGYGSQLNSFICEKRIPAFSDRSLELVFVRAPIISSVGRRVKVLARVDGNIVAAEEENLLVTTFHPELTDDLAVHRYFVNKIGQ